MAANNQIASGSVTISASTDPLVAGLQQAEARVNAWGARTKANMAANNASLSAQMATAWDRHNDTLANKMRAGFEKMQAEQKAKALAASPQVQNQKAAAAQVQAHLDALRRSTDAASGSANALSTGLGGIAKGLKLTETLGMGAIGALAALHKASLDAFAAQQGDKLAAGLEERQRLADKVTESLDKMYATQQGRARNVDDLSSYFAAQGEIETAIKDLEGKEKYLHMLKKLDTARMNDFDRYLGKATLGNIPVFDMIHKQEEQFLKQNLQEAQKRHDDLKRQIEVLRGMSLMGLAKSTVDPLVQKLDDAIGKGKEFLGLVTGNAAEMRKAVDSAMRQGKQDYALAGLDPIEAEIQKKRAEGGWDEQKLAEHRLYLEAAARKQATRAINDQLRAMELETDMYGMTAEAAKRHQLVQAGATADELARFDKIIAKSQAMKDSIEALKAPKVAGAILAGSEQAYAVEVRMKGFDVGDGNAINKANGEKLDKLIQTTKEQAKDIADMKAGFIRIERL